MRTEENYSLGSAINVTEIRVSTQDDLTLCDKLKLEFNNIKTQDEQWAWIFTNSNHIKLLWFKTGNIGILFDGEQRPENNMYQMINWDHKDHFISLLTVLNIQMENFDK
ncbi:MAG: hypothetical protein JWQ09_5809 [Segetibacter sp.]|nr:hypothetical protein [Segetibacter sp.]